MSFSKPIQWYHSHVDPIWLDSIFKNMFLKVKGMLLKKKLNTKSLPYTHVQVCTSYMWIMVHSIQHILIKVLIPCTLQEEHSKSHML